MSKGDLKKNNFYEYIDAFSGIKVIQLTSSDDFNHHPYFYNNLKLILYKCIHLRIIRSIDFEESGFQILYCLFWHSYYFPIQWEQGTYLKWT